MRYAEKAIKGGSIVLIVTGISALLSYFIRILFANSMPLEDLGLFYASFSFVTFLLIFRGFGMDTAVVKFIAHHNAKKETSQIKAVIISSFLFQTLTTIVLVLILLLTKGLLQQYYFKNIQAEAVISLFILYIIVNLLTRQLRHILYGFQEISWYSSGEPIRLVGVIGISLLLFMSGMGIEAAVLAYTMSEIILFFIYAWVARKYYYVLKTKASDIKKTGKGLLSFGVQVIFRGIGNMVISQIDIIILTYFVAMEVVGIYSIVLATALIFILFGRIISTVLFPMVAELWAKRDKKKISYAMDVIYRYAFLVTMPLILGVFFFGKVLLRLFFGSEFLPGMLAFRILLIGTLFYITAMVNNNALSAIGQPQKVAKVILIAAALNLIMNLILIPIFGMDGAAITTTISYIMIFVLSTLYLSRYISIKSPWIQWLKTLIGGMLFILVLYTTKTVLTLSIWPEIIISLTLSSLVYLIYIWMMNLIKRRDVLMILRSFRTRNS